MKYLLLGLLLLPSLAWAQSASPGPFTGPFDLAPTGGYQAGRFYGPSTPGSASAPANAAVGAANTLYAVPFFVPSGSAPVKTLSFDIGTGNAAAWNARMCIYTDSGNWSPSSLVTNSDTGTIAIASGSVTGVQTSSTLNGGSGVSLSGPAWYWLAFNASSNAESIFQSTGTGMGAQRLFGDSVSSGIFNGVQNLGVSVAQTFGACPASFGAASVVRNAAVPYIVVGF